MGVSQRLGNLDPDSGDAPIIFAIRPMDVIGTGQRLDRVTPLRLAIRDTRSRIRRVTPARSLALLGASAADRNQIVRQQPIDNRGGNLRCDLREVPANPATPRRRVFGALAERDPSVWPWMNCIA